MAKKAWGYLVSVFLADAPTNGNPVLVSQFEAEGISPYKVVSGPPNSEVMKSEDYDHLANAMAMGDFIRWIGDKNTLSVKKAHDSATTIPMEAKRDNQSLYGVRLDVTPLSRVPPRARGAARLKALMHGSMESVGLRNVTVTSIWRFIHVKGKSEEQYDFITFEAEEVTNQFAGKDW
jgi:hypothetical protein